MGLELIEKPKTDYIVGESLETQGGRFRLVFDDETTEEHALDEADVQVTGYDSHKEGRQTISISYRGVTTTYDVFVSPKPALNDEYLKQKLAEAAAVQNKVDFSFASQENKDALLKEIASAEQILKDHDTSTQGQVDESLSKLTQAFKALDGRKNFATKTSELDTLATEAQDLLAQKPNHPSGDALLNLLNKNKDLLASSEVTPEALETAKTSLQALIALLKEDKPAVFVDSATGVEVQFSNKETTPVKGLKVEVVEANAAEKEAFAGRLGKVYDIEGVDKEGRDIDTQHASLVKIPVEAGKEVEQVLFFPDNQPVQSLAFEQVGNEVIFTAPHFTHYALVYKTAKASEPDQPLKPNQPSEPDKPTVPSNDHSKPLQPQLPGGGHLSPVQPNANPTVERLNYQEKDKGSAHYQSQNLANSSSQSAKEEVDSKDVKEENTVTSAGNLPNTASQETAFVAEAVLLAALGGLLLAGKKKED